MNILNAQLVKAKAWLDQQGVKYQAIDIKATPPSSEQLAKWMKETGLPVRRFLTQAGFYIENKA